MEYIAHINDKGETQTIKAHSKETAKYSEECLESVQLSRTGYFVGLVHDMGKCKKEWQEYLWAKHREENPEQVTHSFTAVKFIIDTYYYNMTTATEKIACEIIAASIGSHHGLFDLCDPCNLKEIDGLSHRCTDNNYIEATKTFFEEVASLETLNNLFEQAISEIVQILSNVNPKQRLHSVSYLIRLITSALMEGDRRNTAEFGDGKHIVINKISWKENLCYLEEKISEFDASTPINKARRYISDKCKEHSFLDGGIYRLTVPTGGGKTLSSLRYALSHSEKFKKKRIIYAIPLLGILDQNSKVIKNNLADDIVLEHHSNVINEHRDEEEKKHHNYLINSWNSPVIVTTLYQLLETLFSDKTSSIRRMQALCESVIIIDEIQSVPLKFNNMLTTMLNFLATHCSTTIVLCSATPAFSTNENLNFAEPADIVILDEELNEPFNRNQIKNNISKYGYTEGDVFSLVLREIENKDSLLLICNTKSEAKRLFKKIEENCPPDITVYHLSTAMCKKHREDILSKIGKVPGKDGQKVICVSTQLVEAGIDFSFECVVRLFAGLDSIVQAAGRCNRNNDWDKTCDVYVINLKNEKLGPLEHIKACQDATYDLLYEYPDQDMLATETIEKYYSKLYSSTYAKRAASHYVMIDTTEYSLYKMLGTNPYSSISSVFKLRQAFKTAGKNCKVYDEEKYDVVVPYDEKAKSLIEKLYTTKELTRKQIKELSPYTVSLFEQEIGKLKGYLSTCNEVIILSKDAYSVECGVEFPPSGDAIII